MVKRNPYILAAIADAETWKKYALPDAMAFNGPSEARTLLEACQHLCKKIGFDEVVGRMFPNIKKADPNTFRLPPGQILCSVTSPYTTPGELKVAGDFADPFTFNLPK
jgi:hypothetical protein